VILMEMVHLNCECSSPEHTLRMVVDKQSAELWPDVRLNYYPTGLKGFIARLKAAVLYLFGISPRDGHFDIFCFSVKEAQMFRRTLDEFISSRAEATQGEELK
jgi:hypothetical protein